MTRRLKDDITDALKAYYDVADIIDETNYEITFEIIDEFIDDSILNDIVERERGEVEYFDFWDNWYGENRAIITVVNPYNEFN